jgi:Ni,Fe-hydrogenase maturation factor
VQSRAAAGREVMGDYNGMFANEIRGDTLSRAFLARLQAASMSMRELIEQHRHDIAMSMLSTGICLIPSDHLQDNQFVVSRGIYDAARKICNDSEKATRRKDGA